MQGAKVKVGASDAVVVVGRSEVVEVVVLVVPSEEEEEGVEDVVEELAEELAEEVVGAGALLVVDLRLVVLLERGFAVVVLVLRVVVVVGFAVEGGARICFTTDLIASMTSPRLANSSLSAKSSGNSSKSLRFQAWPIP